EPLVNLGRKVDFTALRANSDGSVINTNGTAVNGLESAPSMMATAAEIDADVTLHGFAHINAPYPPFLGNLTTQVRVQQQGPSARVSVTIFTFTGKIILNGSLSGTVAIGACS